MSEFNPIRQAISIKKEVLEELGKKILTRGIYIEAFEHRSAEVQMHPLYAIEDQRQKIIDTLMRKLDTYQKVVALDKAHLEKFQEWLEEQYQAINQLEASSELTEIHEALVKLGSTAQKYRNVIEIQESRLQNLYIKA